MCSPMLVEVADRAGHVREGGVEALPRLATELHVREVIRHQGDYIAKCSCGWVSTACLSEQSAMAETCEIEAVFAVSQWRGFRLR